MFLPVVVALLFGLWQVALLGHASWSAAAAARAGARASALGLDPRAAARAHLPARLERGLRIRPASDAGEVRVSVRVPSLVGAGGLGRVSARSAFAVQRWGSSAPRRAGSAPRVAASHRAGSAPRAASRRWRSSPLCRCCWRWGSRWSRCSVRGGRRRWRGTRPRRARSRCSRGASRRPPCGRRSPVGQATRAQVRVTGRRVTVRVTPRAGPFGGRLRASATAHAGAAR